MLEKFYRKVCKFDLSFLGSKLRLHGDGPQNVSYTLTDSNDLQHYPLLLVPQQDTPIVIPQQGKNCKKGPGEQWLALWIWSHRLMGFHDNVTLYTNGHRYEPDLAYIDEQRGI